MGVLSLTALQSNAQKTPLVDPTDRTWYHAFRIRTTKYYGLIVEKLSIIFIRTKASSIGDGFGPIPRNNLPYAKSSAIEYFQDDQI
jgi:hypothetical protein